MIFEDNPIELYRDIYYREDLHKAPRIDFTTARKSLKDGIWYLNDSFHSCREVLTTKVTFRTRSSGAGKYYNFVDSENNPSDKTESVILLRVCNEPSFKKLMAHLHKITEYEEALGVSEGILRPTNRPQVFALSVDEKWYSSPLLISTLSLLIRYAAKMPMRSKQSIEDYYRQKLKKSICDTNLDLAYTFIQVDLKFVLRNIDFILGKNPISGLNDAEMIKFFSENSHRYMESATVPIDLELDHSSNLSKTRYNISSYYSGLWGGIYKFSNAINEIYNGFEISDIKDYSDESLLIKVLVTRRIMATSKSIFERPINTCYGILWVINYIKLLRERLDDKSTE
jgi:hypothetical protein